MGRTKAGRILKFTMKRDSGIGMSSVSLSTTAVAKKQADAVQSMKRALAGKTRFLSANHFSFYSRF